MTDDLVAFLRARLDEDEQTARAAATRERGGASWSLVDEHDSEVRADSGLGIARRTPPVLARHIARHDPARVLLDVAVKKRILDTAAYAAPRADEDDVLAGVWDALRGAIRGFAGCYADHPDYREEWRP